MTTRTYKDFDEFRATNPQLEGQWLLNGGTNWGWRTDSVQTGSSFILRCYSNTGLIIEGFASNDGYGFYVPFKSGIWRNLGTGFDEDEVVVLEPGSEHCETSKVEDGWHLFFVPEHLVPNLSREPRPSSYTIKDPRARVLRDQITSVVSAVSANPTIESSVAMRTVEAELLSLVLPLLDPTRDDREDDADRGGRSGRNMIEIAHRAQAALEGFDDVTPMTPSLLARQAGVSDRRLRDAFNQRYQIGPRRYLLLRQLHQVRRELLVSQSEDTTVTDTLTSSGVWHFGRFATRYRSLFGERPSETLRRSLVGSTSSYAMVSTRQGDSMSATRDVLAAPARVDSADRQKPRLVRA